MKKFLAYATGITGSLSLLLMGGFYWIFTEGVIKMPEFWAGLFFVLSAIVGCIAVFLMTNHQKAARQMFLFSGITPLVVMFLLTGAKIGELTMFVFSFVGGVFTLSSILLLLASFCVDEFE